MVLKRQLRVILLITATILLIPLIAMQFTNEVQWQFADFVVAALLLIGLGLLLSYVFRKFANSNFRILIIAALIIGFLLIWAELAVGIFGSPLAGD